jgi:hypothetical protein
VAEAIEALTEDRTDEPTPVARVVALLDPVIVVVTLRVAADSLMEEMTEETEEPKLSVREENEAVASEADCEARELRDAVEAAVTEERMADAVALPEVLAKSPSLTVKASEVS